MTDQQQIAEFKEISRRLKSVSNVVQEIGLRVDASLASGTITAFHRSDGTKLAEASNTMRFASQMLGKVECLLLEKEIKK